MQHPISIHAPQHGERLSSCSQLLSPHNFNPRSPARGATIMKDSFIFHFEFQSTLPSTGSDVVNVSLSQLIAISIHAPQHGERRSSDGDSKKTHYFNPRSPARGATHKLVYFHKLSFISIHAPQHGERLLCLFFCPHIFYFNPRSPARGATYFQAFNLQNVFISIHAPQHGERPQNMVIL